MTRVFIVIAAFVVAGLGLAGTAAGQPAPAAPAAPGADLRKTCTDAMNADPTFANDIIKVAGHHVDAQTAKDWCGDQDVLDTHQNAQYHVQKNEQHVIYAYAAMWLVAAGFVVFLWRRQLALRAELARLRRELEDAAKDPAK